MKQKRITAEKYNQKMGKIIKDYKDKDISECFIALIEEAAKWEIIELEETKSGGRKRNSKTKRATPSIK